MKEKKVLKPEEWDFNVFTGIGKDWMLITAGNEKKCNAMTAAWGGFGVFWQKNIAFIGVRSQRYTREFIDKHGAFSLTFFPPSYKKTLAYLGSVSGRNEDKIDKSGLTLTYHSDGTPYFEEAHTTVICKPLYVQRQNAEAFLDRTLIGEWIAEGDFHYVYYAEIMAILQNK